MSTWISTTGLPNFSLPSRTTPIPPAITPGPSTNLTRRPPAQQSSSQIANDEFSLISSAESVQDTVRSTVSRWLDTTGLGQDAETSSGNATGYTRRTNPSVMNALLNANSNVPPPPYPRDSGSFSGGRLLQQRQINPSLFNQSNYTNESRPLFASEQESINHGAWWTNTSATQDATFAELAPVTGWQSFSSYQAPRGRFHQTSWQTPLQHQPAWQAQPQWSAAQLAQQCQMFQQISHTYITYLQQQQLVQHHMQHHQIGASSFPSSPTSSQPAGGSYLTYMQQQQTQQIQIQQQVQQGPVTFSPSSTSVSHTNSVFQPTTQHPEQVQFTQQNSGASFSFDWNQSQSQSRDSLEHHADLAPSMDRLSKAARVRGQTPSDHREIDTAVPAPSEFILTLPPPKLETQDVGTDNRYTTFKSDATNCTDMGLGDLLQHSTPSAGGTSVRNQTPPPTVDELTPTLDIRKKEILVSPGEPQHQNSFFNSSNNVQHGSSQNKLNTFSSSTNRSWQNESQQLRLSSFSSLNKIKLENPHHLQFSQLDSSQIKQESSHHLHLSPYQNSSRNAQQLRKFQGYQQDLPYQSGQNSYFIRNAHKRPALLPNPPVEQRVDFVSLENANLSVPPPQLLIPLPGMQYPAVPTRGRTPAKRGRGSRGGRGRNTSRVVDTIVIDSDDDKSPPKKGKGSRGRYSKRQIRDSQSNLRGHNYVYYTDKNFTRPNPPSYQEATRRSSAYMQNETPDYLKLLSAAPPEESMAARSGTNTADFFKFGRLGSSLDYKDSKPSRGRLNRTRGAFRLQMEARSNINIEPQFSGSTITPGIPTFSSNLIEIPTQHSESSSSSNVPSGRRGSCEKLLNMDKIKHEELLPSDKIKQEKMLSIKEIKKENVLSADKKLEKLLDTFFIKREVTSPTEMNLVEQINTDLPELREMTDLHTLDLNTQTSRKQIDHGCSSSSLRFLPIKIKVEPQSDFDSALNQWFIDNQVASPKQPESEREDQDKTPKWDID
ncbi:uncharacterized protein LOC106673291 [Cimex lectularius]|uniref:Uncharacterized protein n=1 Tax=Cimex lectularius TaxID=79782 RepID=A0A8I6SJQ4_CIMLE|nr:uncharacterized protein LOC106673291 [Cimex lectularius]